jgi:hypothetical protein
MNVRFEKQARYFFWVAGILTTVAAVPIMVSPVKGLHVLTGMSYYDVSPQLAPIVGHWGMMVAGIGVLMFLAATRKELRKTAVIFATAEKVYIVSAALYCFLIHAPYADSYLVPLIADGTMAIGGLWYLLRSRALHQE